MEEQLLEGHLAVTFFMRDKNAKMVHAWRSVFSDYKDYVKVSEGDIFKGFPCKQLWVYGWRN